MPGRQVLNSVLHPGAEVEIERVQGDLVIEGSETSEIRVTGDGIVLEVGKEGTSASISADGDCAVRLPKNVSLTIAEVSGDMRVENIAGPFTLNSVGSDLTLREIWGPVTIDSIGSDARLSNVNGPLTISSIGSDLSARNINGPIAIDNVGSDLEIKRANGPVAVDNVGSDANFREINGNLAIDNVGSDLVIADLRGNLAVDNVGSSLILDTAFNAGTHYAIESVGSDVVVKLAPDTPVTFTIPADTEKTINVRGARIERDDDTATIIVGDDRENAASVTIDSIGSEFQLVSQGKSGFSFNFEGIIPDNLDEIIATRINEQIPRIQENLNRAMERIQHEAEMRAERARERAARAADRARAAAERMQAKVERTKGKAKRGFWMWSGSDAAPHPPHPPHPPQPPRPPRPPVEPVTDQERLAILRMVENKQITIEEAERLLAALEGRE